MKRRSQIVRAIEPDPIRPRRRADRHIPLRRRNAVSRAEARRRIAARPQTPLSPDQQAFDPFARQRSSRARRALKALGSVFGSTAAHALILTLAILIGGMQAKRRGPHDTIAIQVQEEKKPEEKKPEEKKPEPPKKVATREVRVVRQLEPVKPPEPQTPPPKKGPPPRIVGLSLDSTAAGGSGPAFGVGESLMGVTPDRQAEKPKEAPTTAPPPDTKASSGTGQGGTGNKVASRLPTAGVKYTMPVRKQPKKPPYPETLKAQGVESDVTVMVSVDASGKVTDVKLIKPSQYPEFNEAAKAAATAEEFEPATRDGQPIPYTLSYTYRFRLEDE